MQNKQFLSPLFTFLVSMFSSILSTELFKMNKYQLQSHNILKKTKNKARIPALETHISKFVNGIYFSWQKEESYTYANQKGPKPFFCSPLNGYK